MKIYYITSTYIMDSNVFNCGGIRNRYVELLRKRYEVIVVTPNYMDKTIKIGNGFICLPYHMRSIDRYLQRVGIYEDYLDSWAKDCIACLEKIVANQDIIFATTGGELAGVKIADEIKKRTKCRTIINFHDPINYTTVNGIKTGGRYRNLHVQRDRVARKYIQTADYIITSSDSFKKILEEIYPNKKGTISNIYFGYIDKVGRRDECRKPSGDIKMIYAGSMGMPQRAESIMEIWGSCENVRIEYVGSASSRIKNIAKKYPNVTISPSMQHEEYLKYMKAEADVGLVSLVGDEWGACVPSKIFELINLEIPILAILPDGDAKDLINNGFGFAAGINEPEKHQENLFKMRTPECYIEIVENMRREKAQWHMDFLFKKVEEIIEKVAVMDDFQ